MDITYPPQAGTVQGYCTVWERATWYRASTFHGTCSLALRCRSKGTSTASANYAPAKEQESHTATQTLHRRHPQVRKASEPHKRPVSRSPASVLDGRQSKGICPHLKHGVSEHHTLPQSGPGVSPAPPRVCFGLVWSGLVGSSSVRVFLCGFSAPLFLGVSPRLFPRFRVFPVFFPFFLVGGVPGRFDGLNKFSPSWTKLL